MRHKFDRWQVSLMAVIMLMLGIMLGMSLGGAAYAWSPPAGENVVLDNARSVRGKDTVGTEQNLLTLYSNTCLNTPAGKDILFTVNNAEKARLTSTGSMVLPNGVSYSAKNAGGTVQNLLTLWSNTCLNAPAGKDILFTVNNGERARMTSTGSVGIGDTTPVEAKLVVRNTSGSGIFASTGGKSECIHGENNDSSGCGVSGRSSSGLGVAGISTSGTGVRGDSSSGPGISGYSSSNYGVFGSSDNSYAGYFDGDVRVTGDLEVGPAPAVKLGRIYLEASGTIISTDGGTRVLLWDKENYAIKMTNTSGDWIDYWWQTQKFDETGGYSDMLDPGISGVTIISGIDANTYGIEIHFGQADGTEGWCSVWLQYAYGKLVGHYIKY